MTSSMLAGERRWASSRRGGMTVLGKVAVPKPINLPSQKLENHGLDPNVEIVPKGSLSWGSRPSSSTSNPWGSSAVSPNTDGTTVSPHHSSGRPSSGGGLSRPSTAGSDRHEPSATTWGPNSRPSSASGVLTSNQSALASSRPLSAETRPGSSHLSRFAETGYDNSTAWGPSATADKLSVPSKVNDFSLSSGDFPTLGSEKDNTSKNSEPHDHGSHVRPGSSSGRTAPAKERNEMVQSGHKSGTVDTWTRDGSPNFEDGVHPNADKWQGDPHQYLNPNMPPQHYDAWRGPPMNAPPGVWYRGPPPAGPPYPPVPHGGFPMEPFPYYRPQIPPSLANSQSGPPPGAGPRGHHPRNGDFYRPQMPDAFIRPGMPMRPGFYPGPVPYDGYFGPPMGYNPNDRDMPFMGMPPGPHGPPVYNMCPPQHPPEPIDPHFKAAGRGPVGNMFVSETMDSVPSEESRGPYKVLRKRENERNAEIIEDNWEQHIEKSDQLRPSLYKTDTRRNEDMPSRRNTSNLGYPSDPVIVHSSEGPHRSKASNESWGNKASFPEDPKDSSLIQNEEGLNAKVQASDVQGDAVQSNELIINHKGNSTIAFGSIPIMGDFSHPYDKSRQVHHGVRNQVDNHNRGRLSNQDTDGWRKKPPVLGSEVAALENYTSAENPDSKNTSDLSTQMVDLADGQEQRARMREMAKQRAIERQKEEEERIREQKAKAQAKLEELNRRTLAAADGTIRAAEKTATSVPEQVDVDGSQKPIGLSVDDSKQNSVDQINENNQQEPADQSLLVKQGIANATDAESKTASLRNDGGAHRQKRASHKQKPSVQTAETLVDKSALSGTGGAVVTSSGSSGTVSSEAVSSQEPTPPNNSSIASESTQQKKRNNKNSKNKHKLDDASASKEVDLSKPESPHLDSNPSTMEATDSKYTKQSNLEQVSSLPSNQHKPHHTRKMPRNPQVNRFHVGDVAVWAPVRVHNKEETVQDDMPLPEKSVASSQTNLKSKRAEMERYVPKPVAKELAQQGNINQSALPSSPKKTTLEDMTDRQDVGSGSQPSVPASVTVGVTAESKSDNKQSKHVKPHGSCRQRDQGFQQDFKKSHHKSTSQHEEPNPDPTETNVKHEWDPSDGWFMPDEYPPTEVTSVANVVKDDGGVTGKEKRPAYKGQRSMVKNHKDISGAEIDVDQTDRPASSKDNRSHWQPKPQPHKGGWSSGGQASNSEFKKESRRYSSQAPHEEPAEGNQEGRRERKPSSFRGQAYSPNIEDEAQAQFEQQQQHQVSTGFRKYGGQNNRPGGQDDKRKHIQNNPNPNRERQRPNQNLHYEYQPVGSNNNNSNKFSSLDALADGSGNAGSRYKERSSGQGQPRRGGGNFYGRQ